jgi:hypothetical protein
MRRDTGPGQVDARPLDNTRTPPAREALLYNFDIDDATLKQRHRDWLDDNIVAAFRTSPGSEVLLQGTASRSGVRSYNLELSRRRVDAVRQYLTGRGVPASRIDTSFTGEELSRSISSEDPHDRAVKTIFEFAAVPGTRFQGTGPLAGFEASTTPDRMDSLIVPAPGSNFVTLAAPGVVGFLTVQNPNIASVNPSRGPFPPRIQILGLVPGITVLEAWDTTGTFLLAELEVVVKPRVQKTVAFHIVGDSSTPPHRSRRSTASIRRMFDALNTLYNPQAGIFFTWDGTVRTIRVTSVDLSNKLVLREENGGLAGPGWDEILAQGDPSVDLRVYFVPDVDLEGTPVDEFGAANGIPSNDLVIGDDTPLDFESKVIGHETGHCLGLHHDDGPNPDQLISNVRVLPPGLRISRANADTVNPGVQAPSPPARLRRR